MAHLPMQGCRLNLNRHFRQRRATTRLHGQTGSFRAVRSRRRPLYSGNEFDNGIVSRAGFMPENLQRPNQRRAIQQVLVPAVAWSDAS
jgi:hypothetical protein